MERFVIRNYGTSRNLPDGHGSYIFLEHDAARPTNDEDMAKLFATYPDVEVKERDGKLVGLPEPVVFAKPPEGPAPPDEPPDRGDIQGKEEDEQGKDDQNEDSEVESTADIEYETLLLGDLQEIAKERDPPVPTSGVKKADLVVALQEWDAQQAKLSKLTVGRKVKIDTDEDETIYLITVLPEQPDGEFTLEPEAPDGNEYGATADQLTIVEDEVPE